MVMIQQHTFGFNYRPTQCLHFQYTEFDPPPPLPSFDDDIIIISGIGLGFHGTVTLASRGTMRMFTCSN